MLHELLTAENKARPAFLASQAAGIRSKAAQTHHFFLPMRNFFFMKTIYLRGTQTSRAMEVI